MVSVVAGQLHFSAGVGIHKTVLDEQSGIRRWYLTWSHVETDFDGDTDSTKILATLSQVMDVFIDEYLRVNSEACAQATPQ